MCLFTKAIYGLKQSPRTWLEKFNNIVTASGFQRCVVDHSVLYRRTSSGCVILVVYVDDILLIGSDTVGIQETKEYSKVHFVTKDMGRPNYFLGIEFVYTKNRMVLSQGSMS